MDNLNKINGNKDLYDRICVWMADWDDVESGTPSKEPYTVRASAMAEEAHTLFYDIYQTCIEETEDDPNQLLFDFPERDDVEGVPV